MVRTGTVLKDHVAAVSCGLSDGVAVLDLDYAEDSVAGTDANFVMTGDRGLIEVQGSAEGATFSRAQLMDEFWDGETSASLRAVDVYITRIRDKMSVSDDFKITTVHGLGYKAVPGA